MLHTDAIDTDAIYPSGIHTENEHGERKRVMLCLI